MVGRSRIGTKSRVDLPQKKRPGERERDEDVVKNETRYVESGTGELVLPLKKLLNLLPNFGTKGLRTDGGLGKILKVLTDHLF